MATSIQPEVAVDLLLLWPLTIGSTLPLGPTVSFLMLIPENQCYLTHLATGSGRKPAHFNGCFSLRPTHDLLSSEGLATAFE